MPDLRKARSKLQVAVGALLILDVAAVVLLLSPYAGSEATRKQQMRQLWLDLKSRETAPWRGLDKSPSPPAMASGSPGKSGGSSCRACKIQRLRGVC